MFKIHPLFSGSSGNSTLVQCNGTNILVDAGRSATAICKALSEYGLGLNDIDGILITHEHIDHTSSLENISKKFKIPIHFAKPSYDEFVQKGSCLYDNAISHDIEYSVEFNDVSVKSFKIPHDSVCNVGFTFVCEDDKFSYATDIGHLTDEIYDNLCGSRVVVIESNHDIDMLKNGPYPQYLKERIMSKKGHLSNDDCSKLSLYLAQNGTKEIILAHLSDKNNEPELAKAAVDKILNENGYHDIILTVAPKNSLER